MSAPRPNPPFEAWCWNGSCSAAHCRRSNIAKQKSVAVSRNGCFSKMATHLIVKGCPTPARPLLADSDARARGQASDNP